VLALLNKNILFWLRKKKTIHLYMQFFHNFFLQLVRW